MLSFGVLCAIVANIPLTHELVWQPTLKVFTIDAGSRAQAEAAYDATCPVAPLEAINDPAAVAFEHADSSGVVDVAGLTPATARALAKFENVVERKGGKVKITSAFRPASYQAHLADVWYKWMRLKDDENPACQSLKAQVGGEFVRHRLLETQHPVPFSDHTKGVGFDAAVMLPVVRARRRVLAIDWIARLCHLRRPDVLHDPVHFRFLTATSEAGHARRSRRGRHSAV